MNGSGILAAIAGDKRRMAQKDWRSLNGEDRDAAESPWDLVALIYSPIITRTFTDRMNNFTSHLVDHATNDHLELLFQEYNSGLEGDIPFGCHSPKVAERCYAEEPREPHRVVADPAARLRHSGSSTAGTLRIGAYWC